MPLSISSSIPCDTRHLAAMRNSLHDFFGVHFDLWLFDNVWNKIAADELSDLHVATALEAELVNVVRTSKPPPNFSLIAGETDTLLVLPLHKRHRQFIAASARFENSQADLVGRLARLFVKNLAIQDEVVQLRQEHEAFLRQVTNDFEELTFLRSMASLLEVSNLTFDFVAMGEVMLTTLKPLVDSDALVLVPSECASEETPESEPAARCVWSGMRCITDSMCIEIVRRFRQLSVAQPVVKNYFDRTDEGREFPGVHSFIVVPIASKDDTIGWLVALNRNNDRNNNVEQLPWELSYLEFGTHEATLMSSSAAILATHARNVQLFRERENLLVSIVRSLVSAVEAKDEYTRGHSERVALYSRCIADQMGFDQKYCEQLYLTGLLHDVGKIGVGDAILRKTGPLTDEEFEEIKKHPDKGWQIMKDLRPLNYVLDGILYHHEQFDGRGYPDRLAGSDIPLAGRILAVADAYDAMTSDRPYRTGMPHEKAESILRNGAGKQWDAAIIDAFFRGLQRILEIKTTYQPRIAKVRR
jgi:HD-GYP domain-containing protein (c-di-GMP phosphodiesterase class II)